MTNRYHIKKDGNPAPCDADEGNCPKGGEHFDNEQDARAAVEKLFGDSFNGISLKKPLPVYTKTAVKEQWSEYMEGRTGFWPDFHEEHPFVGLGANRVAKRAMDIILDSRLDVKSQNEKAKMELNEYLTEVQFDRKNGDEQSRLDAAMGTHIMMNVLGKNYGIQDPRNENQKRADEAYLSENISELDSLPEPAYEDEVKFNSSEFTDENIDELAALGKIKNLNNDDLRQIQEINPFTKTKEPLRKTDKENTLIDKIERDSAMLIHARKVPAEMIPYLNINVAPEVLADNINNNRKRILTVGESRWALKHSVSIFKFAKRVKIAREYNNELLKNVLDA